MRRGGECVISEQARVGWWKGDETCGIHNLLCKLFM